MAMSTSSSRPSGGALTEVLDLILDRGVVIDVYVRISLVGIQLLTIEARIVVASIDTYLRYAEAVGRLNLDSGRKLGAQDLITGGTTENANGTDRDRLSGVFGALGERAARPSPVPLNRASGDLAAENQRLRERVDRLERELAPPGDGAAGHARGGHDG